MTLPYLARLFVVCSAAFFLIHSALALVACLSARRLSLWVERLAPRSSANLLLTIRLLPTALTLLILFGFCIPSYLWLEPGTRGEEVGFACALMALMGGLAWAMPIWRTVSAIAETSHYLSRCQQGGKKTSLPGETAPVLVVEEEAPILVIAGVVHPQLVVSRRVVRDLDAEQMEAAMRHEQAHRLSRDNFKRLLILLAPDILPFTHGFSALERRWAKFAEWAADDHAVAGDSRRALSLASALVAVAKINTKPRIPALATGLVGNDHDLSERVDRLLDMQASPDPSLASRFPRAFVVASSAAIVALLVVWPASLSVVHELLEKLIH